MAPAPFRLVVLLLAAVATGSACGRNYFGPPPVVDARIRVGVLPFRTGGTLNETGRFVASVEPPAMPELLGEEIAHQLRADLEALGVTMIDGVAMLRATPQPGAAMYGSELGARVGATVNADYAVVGAISRFRQREGSAIGVEKPASIAYRVVLVRVETARMVGIYTLDYTQAPLSEELTQLPEYLQGGGGWQTREGILERSLSQTARKLARTIVSPPTS